MKKTTTKRVVWLCLANGCAWVWMSYILAFLGRVEIAESLSRAAITEILGVVLIYCLKSLFENISKNNSWPDKPGGPCGDRGPSQTGRMREHPARGRNSVPARKK